MRQAQGNLWTWTWRGKSPDAICITTNGDIDKQGQAVMGRGVALEAKLRYPNIEKNLAYVLGKWGNLPNIIWTKDPTFKIVSFPVKHHWYEDADLELITLSAARLDHMAGLYGWKIIALPRPGCGVGQLSWNEVEPILSEWLDNRFYVVDLAGP